MLVGKVKWFDSVKGYGFITANEHDYFVHFSSIESSRIFKTLHDGREVEFIPETSDRGLVAKEVREIEVKEISK